MPLRFGSLVFRGREVTLRPLTLDDAGALASAAAGSREHYRYSPVPDGMEQARAYVSDALGAVAAGQRYPFAVIWKDRVVGTTSYAHFEPWAWPPGSPMQRHDRPDGVEIGYTWLGFSAQRTRCNTEAKFLLLQNAFDNWAVHRVSLRTDRRNERSRRAIERLGASFDGVLRGDKPATDGTVRDSAFYSIMLAEWPAVRARLTAVLVG
jgi:RimJ/RimL family protein N-acetyltransferase